MTGSATVKIPANLSLCGGEIQNAKLQSLATKSNPVEADFWYDSVNHKPVYYNGSAVKDFGKEYSAGTGISLSGTTISIDTSTVALKSDLVTAYTPAGNVDSASDLPTLSASVLGKVYHVTTSFNTTSDFVEGSGKPIPVGNDITVVDVGTGSSHSYKFNVYGDFIDISGKQDASTAVTHTASTAVGSTTTPIYVASDGKATALEYTIAKSVPSNAVFTDTKNTAGSTDTSSKIFLVGATSQAANPQTYSHDTAFVDANGRLNSAAPATSANDTTVATTKWVKDQSYATIHRSTNNTMIAVNGVCEWAIPLPTSDVDGFLGVTIYELPRGNETGSKIIYPSVTFTTGYAYVYLLTSSDIIEADTYLAVLVY